MAKNGGKTDDTAQGRQSRRERRNLTQPGERLSQTMLIAEHGSVQGALKALAQKVNDLEADAADYREDIRDLKAKLPGAEDVVLTGEEAAAYAKLREKKQTVLTLLSDHQKALDQITTLGKGEKWQQAATAAKASMEALKLLPSYADLEPVVEGEGKDQKVYVEYKEGDAKVRRLLSEYVEEKWKALKPAIFPEQATGQQGGSQQQNGQQQNGQQQQEDSWTFPSMDAGSGGEPPKQGGADYVNSFIKNTYGSKQQTQENKGAAT